MAMKGGDSDKVGVLRQILAALKNESLEKRRREKLESDVILDDSEVIKVLKREHKKRLEAFGIYAKAGRGELAAKEDTEAKIISSYLPRELSEDEVKKLVQKVIDSGVKNQGEAIKEVMKAAGGQVNGKVVSELVRAALGNEK